MSEIKIGDRVRVKSFDGALSSWILDKYGADEMVGTVVRVDITDEGYADNITVAFRGFLKLYHYLDSAVELVKEETDNV